MDLREFDRKSVPDEVKRKVLEAARLTGSGINAQHWRFVLVQKPENMKRLSEDSTSGRWIGGANFAVLVLTNPKYNFHSFDAGRVVQDMQLAAWNFGVASGIYTGFDEIAMAKHFSLPKELDLAAAIGFGYPSKTIKGKKNRRPLVDLAFSESYGEKLAI